MSIDNQIPGPPKLMSLKDSANLLEAYYDGNLSSIADDELRQVANMAVFPWLWDNLSPEERKKAVLQNFEETNEDFNEAFLEACVIGEIERDIRDMELMSPKNPTELIAKRSDLEALRAKHEEQLAAIRNRATKSPEVLVAELRSQQKEDWEIAGALLLAFKEISSYQIGKLLPARPGTTIADESVSKRGRELKKLWINKGVRTPTKNPKQIR